MSGLHLYASQIPLPFSGCAFTSNSQHGQGEPELPRIYSSLRGTLANDSWCRSRTTPDSVILVRTALSLNGPSWDFIWCQILPLLSLPCLSFPPSYHFFLGNTSWFIIFTWIFIPRSASGESILRQCGSHSCCLWIFLLSIFRAHSRVLLPSLLRSGERAKRGGWGSSSRGDMGCFWAESIILPEWNPSELFFLCCVDQNCSREWLLYHPGTQSQCDKGAQSPSSASVLRVKNKLSLC